MLNTFSCTCWPSVCLLQKKCFLRSSAHFLIWLVFFFFFFLQGAACIGPSAEERPSTSAWSGLGWWEQAFKKRPLWNWLVFIFFFCYWVVGVLCIFWILIPYQIHNMQILSPILQIAFSFCWWRRFFCAETFYFDVVPLIFLLMPLLAVSDPKDHCQDQCYGVYGLCFLQEFYDPRYYLQVLNFELILHSWKRIHQPAIFLQFFFCTLVSDGGGICVTRIKWVGIYIYSFKSSRYSQSFHWCLYCT